MMKRSSEVEKKKKKTRQKKKREEEEEEEEVEQVETNNKRRNAGKKEESEESSEEESMYEGVEGYVDPIAEEEEEEEEILEDEEDEEEMREITKGLENLEYIETDGPVLIPEKEEKNTTTIEAYIPGKHELKEGETLEVDMSAYHMLHSITTDWPCLSFDIFPDRFGYLRTKYPFTMFTAMGTQANRADKNQLIFMKISDLYPTHDGDSEDDEPEYEEPVLQYDYVQHKGAVNRVKVMPQRPYIVATWSEEGCVYLWDPTKSLNFVDEKGASARMKPPIATLNHGNEGFALSWSPNEEGRLLSGGLGKEIRLTEQIAGVFQMLPKAYTGHQGSVEDIQWSPTESQVFASCSSDASIKIWDVRMKESCGRSFIAAKCDVNAISWNRHVPYLMLSGADDGGFRIWDMRTLKSKDGECQSLATFTWHRDQITSVEWCPTDDSMLAVASADDQITVWDLSTEEDNTIPNKYKEPSVPPQLLFIHQGQTDPKEIHWHPQIQTTLLSSAENMFNVFRPAITVDD